MSIGGYIRVHRKLMENDLYFAEPFTRAQAWLDLLLLANYAPGKFVVRGCQVFVGRGELAGSVNKLMHRWQWSDGKVKRFLAALEAEGQIKIRHSLTVNVIAIVKYDLYQRGAGDPTEYADFSGENPQYCDDGDPTDNPTDNPTNDPTDNLTDNPTESRCVLRIKPGKSEGRDPTNDRLDDTDDEPKTTHIRINKEINKEIKERENNTHAPAKQNCATRRPVLTLVEPSMDEQPENQPERQTARETCQRLVDAGVFNEIQAEAYYAKTIIDKINYGLACLEAGKRDGKGIRNPQAFFMACVRDWVPGATIPDPPPEAKAKDDEQERQKREIAEAFDRQNNITNQGGTNNHVSNE